MKGSTALVGAIACAMVHYTFGDWARYPHVALWHERAFWAGIPAAMLVPALQWVAWSALSLGRLKPARLIFMAGAVVCLGDLVWFLAWLNLNAIASLFKASLERVTVDYWEWWGWWMPGVVLVGNVVLARRCLRLGGSSVRREVQPRSRPKSWLKGLAAYVGICAVTLTVIHLVLPRMRVNQMTQSVARALLVRAEWERDFDFLVQNPQMQGKRLGAILEHAELAHLQRPQFYSALEESTYQDFVLSPVVDALPVSEVDWRRSFWDHFYPRVRKEHDAMSAAQIVVRFLRERVGIDPANASRVGPETIWEQQMTDEKGFERTYVAALRSVGVAARLNEGHRTEMWWGNAWVEAPRPIIASWSTSIEKNN